jgi:hypothetical protein
MSQVIQRSRLFLGSYALLFLLLAIRFESSGLRATCAILAAVGIIDMTWIVFGVSRRTAGEPIVVTAVTDAGAEVSGYLATYLLPFLTVASPSANDIAAYAIFLFVTGLVYVRSEMTQINPTIYALGRRVVHVTTDRGWSGYVIARSSIQPEDVIRTATLNTSVRVESRKGVRTGA